MKVLKIYSRTCGPCKVLESNLQLAGIPHESIDVQSIQGEDIDYSTCDLKGAVEEQIVLPQKAWNYIVPKTKREINAIFDLKGWNVDDFEVVEG